MVYQDIRNQEMNQIQETIETAIRNGTSVWIDYTDEKGSKSSGREFKAEAMIVQKDGTNLNGRDPTAGYRSFRLDRVSKVYTSKPVEEWKVGDVVTIDTFGTDKYVIVRSFTGRSLFLVGVENGVAYEETGGLEALRNRYPNGKKVGTLAASVK
jgi:hypothetical protein